MPRSPLGTLWRFRRETESLHPRKGGGGPAPANGFPASGPGEAAKTHVQASALSPRTWGRVWEGRYCRFDCANASSGRHRLTQPSLRRHCNMKGAAAKFVGIKEGDPVRSATVTLYYLCAVAGHTDDFIALTGCSVLPELNGLDVTFAGSVEASMPSPMATNIAAAAIAAACACPNMRVAAGGPRAVAPLQADPRKPARCQRCCSGGLQRPATPWGWGAGLASPNAPLRGQQRSASGHWPWWGNQPN